MTTGDGIDYKTLNDCLEAQSKRIEGYMDKVEGRLAAEIARVETDIDKDVADVNSRVTYLERKSQRDTVIGSAISFIGAILVGLFGGTNN